MKYSVLLISGKQYKVSEGETILVDKLNGTKDVKVLLMSDEGKVLIGKPYLENAKVSLKVGETVKGTKIDVFKYKAKARSRRHVGFRPQYSPVTVEKVVLSH